MIIAYTFAWPVGPRGLARPDQVYDTYYVYRGFLDERYKAEEGVEHTGEDWNGNGGGNTDFRDPIRCTANGIIVAIEYYQKGFGHVLVIKHVLPDLRVVYSMYAHLDEIPSRLSVGQVVIKDEFIGWMGRSGGPKYAHLHFEIRLDDLPPDNWYPTVHSAEAVKSLYTEPRSFIASRWS